MGGGSSLPFELQKPEVPPPLCQPHASAPVVLSTSPVCCLSGCHLLLQFLSVGSLLDGAQWQRQQAPPNSSAQEVTGTNIVVEIRLLSGRPLTKMQLPCTATAGDLRRALQGAPVMQDARLIAGSDTLEDHQQLQSCAVENGKVEICIVLDPRTPYGIVLAQQKYEREQDVKFEKYMAKNTKMIEEFGSARKTMLQELENAKERWLTERFDLVDVEYDKLQNEVLEKFYRRVEEVNDVPKTKKPSVAILGPSGVGKSALINALVGTLVTPEGMVYTTAIASKVYESPTTEFWDVPGQDEQSSFFHLKRILAIKEMHLIIIMYVHPGKPTMQLIPSEKFIRACKVPCVCVRSKVDQLEEEWSEYGYDTATQVKKEALENETKGCSAPLIFVSAKTGEGLDSLKSSAMKLGVSLD